MSRQRNLLLLSVSNLKGYGYLEHAKEQLTSLFSAHNVRTVLFVPYAQRDHDAYVRKVASALNPWGYAVEGIHTKTNASEAVRQAEAIFIGGGNTFVLLKTLYELQLIEPIRERVLEHGLPYVGSSAGTNVATRSINTTNDMPVVHPPSFDALALVPFNINPHYMETDTERQPNDETRDERIEEFIDYQNGRTVVVGLREGTSLRVRGDSMTLLGLRAAKLFRHNQPPQEYEPNADLSFLLKTEK